jgi:hypothetical protein
VTLISPKRGTSGSVTASGKLRIRFKWVRNQINGVDDTTDNPPATLNLVVHLWAGSFFDSDDVVNAQVTSQVGIENGASYPGSQEAPTSQSPIYLSQIDKYIPIQKSTSSMDSQERIWSDWFTFDGSTQGDVTLSAPYSRDAQTSFGFDWVIDDRALEISSSAEPTYHKGANGEPEENTGDTQDVAATWNEALNMWYWNGAFDANLSGSLWDSPTYTWAAGSLLQYNQNNPNLYVSSISNAQYILPSYTEAAGPGGPYSLAVSAEDTDGRYVAGTYAMNFHKPYHWTKIGNTDSLCDSSDAPHGPYDISFTPVDVAPSVTFNYDYDPKKVDINWGEGLSIGSATIGAAGAISVVLTDGATAPAALGLISSVMGGAGTVVSSLPAAPTHTTSLSDTTYAKYKDAVTNASNDVTYPDNQAYYDVSSISAQEQPGFLANLIDHFTTNEDGDGDVEYEGHTYVTGKAHFVPSKRLWETDEYGPNGYIDHVPGVSYYADTIPTVQITWSPKQN